MPTRTDIEAVAEEVFTALADPSRRAILAALAAGGPATATDLATRLPISRQAIAKHLALLAGQDWCQPNPGSGVGCATDFAPLPCRWRNSSWPPWPGIGTASSMPSRTTSTPPWRLSQLKEQGNERS